MAYPSHLFPRIVKTILWIIGGIAAVPLFILLSVVVVVVWTLVTHTPPDPECSKSKEILVKIDDTVFALPRKYKPSLDAMDSAEQRRLSKICYKEGDPPVAVGGFTLYDIPMTNKPNPDVKYAGNARMRNSVNMLIFGKIGYSRNGYFSERRKVINKGIAITDLLRKGDFFVDEVAESSYFLIADVINKKEPALTITCGKPFTHPTGVYMGRLCRSSDRMEQKFDIYYQFRDVNFPPETWLTLHQHVTEFINHIIVPQQ